MIRTRNLPELRSTVFGLSEKNRVCEKGSVRNNRPLLSELFLLLKGGVIKMSAPTNF